MNIVEVRLTITHSITVVAAAVQKMHYTLQFAQSRNAQLMTFFDIGLYLICLTLICLPEPNH